ncbi:MAG: hypothetical protein WC723_01715 [Candidatus Omnitrophota bacterium]
MKNRRILILCIAVFLVFISTNLVFSQEGQDNPDTQWVWGEVSALDAQARTILVKYLDYETDQEKDINVSIADATTYENIKSLDELKLSDAVSIDYVVSPDGKNIAKNISVEKIENMQGAQEGSITEQKAAVPAE